MKKKRKVRFEAYRDIRRSEAADRRSAKIPVTLAGARPIFKREQREHLVHKVIDVMRDWRLTPFENEGSAVAGMRSALCLDGYPWMRSHLEAQETVATALRAMGAKRPSYDEGQQEYTERDGVCVWCHGEIDTAGAAYGRTGKFCSNTCAEAMRLDRAGEWDLRSSAVSRAASRAVARERLQPLACLNCSQIFLPISMDARGRKFCSHACVGAFRAILPPKMECQQCAKTFQPENRSAQFCSVKCQGMSRRTLHPQLCANSACAAMFRPKYAEQKFCSRQCADAVNRDAAHPRECLWCQRAFMSKSPTSMFCNVNCKSMEYQFRTGRKVPKRISPPVFDYVFRMAA